MKNIHVLPKPNTNSLVKLKIFSKDKYNSSKGILPIQDEEKYINIYITSDEEIKDGDWMIRDNENPIKLTKDFFWDFGVRYYKIVLTDNEDLIKDSVQSIDDEFLEWFVKNPSCEEVEVEPFHGIKTSVAEINAVSGDGSLKWRGRSDLRDYKIIIPKEEPKQETLEEVAEKYSKRSSSDVFQEAHKRDFINGAKWQQEQNKNKYSAEEVYKLTLEALDLGMIIRQDQLNSYSEKSGKELHKEWFKQLENK